MNYEEFKESLAGDAPMAGSPTPLAALWWDAKGDWARAHSLVGHRHSLLCAIHREPRSAHIANDAVQQDAALLVRKSPGQKGIGLDQCQVAPRSVVVQEVPSSAPTLPTSADVNRICVMT
jgi:hypothetical protein